MPGLIAIVGRPNVGKSALFNRIVGRRIAIVHDHPGVTRDRVTAEAEFHGLPFTLVDTGGIGLVPGEKSQDVLLAATVRQVDIAIEAADVILFVVSIRDGILPLDREVASRFQSHRGKVILVANKADTSEVATAQSEFEELGFADILAVSAIHGRGIDALLKLAAQRLPAPESGSGPGTEDAREGQEAPLKLSILGRPNVGKSSIINALTQSERVLVSPIPGTTRDAVDVPFEVETDGRRQSYLLIDTAGVRKKARVKDAIEFFSVNRTEHAVTRCDIAVLVMDAEEGVTEQDKKMAGQIQAAHKACILVVNKWDLTSADVLEARKEVIARRNDKERKRSPEKMSTLHEFGKWVQRELFFMDYAPVIFTSATEGFQLDRLLEAVRYVGTQWKQSIPTALLNRTLQDAFEQREPPLVNGRHRLKLYYATQTSQAPPIFNLYVNRPDDLSDHYTKYLVHHLRKAFGFEGCPIRLRPQERPRKVSPIRRPKKAPGKGARKPSPAKGKTQGRPEARSRKRPLPASKNRATSRNRRPTRKKG